MESFKIELLEHQKKVYDIFEKGETNSMLLFHEMGMGKTITSLSIYNIFKDYNFIILSPASLKRNFLINLNKLYKDEKIKDKINFVSTDYNKAHLKFKEVYKEKNFIIIDECHNFIKSIYNSIMIPNKKYSNAYKIYKLLKNKNKTDVLLLLSGTPITKDYKEFYIIQNLLNIKSEKIFDDILIKQKETVIIRKKMLNKKISIMKINDSNFPDYLGMKIVKCRMNREREDDYYEIFDKENKKGYNIEGAIGKFFVRSRIISNFDQGVSEKASKMVKKIVENDKMTLVYSQFVSGGINVVEKELKTKTKFKDYFDPKSEDYFRYVILNGQTKQEIRSKILNIWNSEENIYGKKIKIVLVSKVGSEGIDLKYGREIHILEPYWDLSRIDQIKSRFVRIGSHNLLKDDERNVISYLYINYPLKEYKSIDEKLYEIAKEKKRKIDILFEKIEKYSI